MDWFYCPKKRWLSSELVPTIIQFSFCAFPAQFLHKYFSGSAQNHKQGEKFHVIEES